MRRAMIGMMLTGGVIISAIVADRGLAQFNPTAPTMAVSVVNPSGQPVAGAVVCAGALVGGSEMGGGVTGPAGSVTITLRNAEPDPIRPRQIVVTGGSGAAGASMTSMGPGSVTIRLPASGGTRCPGDTVTTGNSQRPIAINRNALDRDLSVARSTAAAGAVQRIGAVSTISEKCFGAVGMACGNILAGEVSTCGNKLGACTINVGSWKHDQCCVANASGGVCKLNPAAPWAKGGFSSSDTICQGDFDMAARRFSTGLNWIRLVDRTKINTTGIVDHADYCAPSGTRMVEGEAEYCCSRRLRQPNVAEQVITPALNRLISGLDRLRICT